MKQTEAIDIIASVMAALPDEVLPELRIEQKGDERIAWSGDHARGLYLNSGRRNGEPDPSVYVRQDAANLFHAEAVRRFEIAEAQA